MGGGKDDGSSGVIIALSFRFPFTTSQGWSMPGWIKLQGSIGQKYKPFFVFRSEDATRLSEGNAQQVRCSATDAYPNYIWKSIRLSGVNEYIVEGSEKPRTITR